MAVPAGAHDYMIGDNWASLESMAGQAQGILDAMMNEFAGCNLWSTSCNGQTAIWSTILGQRGPGWTPVGGYTADHAASRAAGWAAEQTFVRADYHFAFLEEALKPGACLEGVPPARIQEIRNAFNNNKNRVMSTEITLYGVRVQATVLGCDNDITRDVTTGGTINFGVKAGTPYPICSTVYTVNEGLPSLFGTGNGGPLLDEAHPQLRDLLANMTAAYMTIGDSRVVDYWYVFMGRLGLTFVSELLPGLIANIGKEDTNGVTEPGTEIFEAIMESFSEITLEPDKSDKAPCQPWGNVGGVNVSKNVCGLPVIGCVNIDLTVSDGNVCLSLRNFADKFNCSSYTCLPEYLAVKDTQGDLNADGRRNVTSWFQAMQNLQEWKVKEGAGGYLDITLQPVPPAGPVDYGSTYNMSTNGVSSVPIAYQWYAGSSPATLAPVAGATTRDYAPTIDIYSFNGTTMSRYFRVDLSGTYCGSNHVVSSNVVKVDGGAPPPITIFEQPAGGNVYPGGSVTLTVNAGALAGAGLGYQWQKWNSGTSTWDNIAGATAAIYSIPVITPADGGSYRVQVINQVAPSPVYWVFSDSANLNVAPEIIINPQPLSAEIVIGSNYTLSVDATVSSGTLEYRWQVNTGFGFQNLTDWGTQKTWDIVGAQIGDAGSYRCQVRNTLVPFGTYIANSDLALITISSGTVFRVDKTAPGPVRDGLTWATAFTTIQAGINAAAAVPGGGEVWVAGGPVGSPVVYNEARTEPWGGLTGAPGRVQGSLIMKSNVRVYGGFEGYRSNTGLKEQYRDQRVLAQNRAVIDGRVARAGAPAYHVVVFGRQGEATTNSTLDGFDITGGNAAGISGDYHSWRGGGIYNWKSAPTIANCYIYGNTAAVAGGGICNEGSEGGFAGAVIMNCIFQGNAANRAADDYNQPLAAPHRGPAPNPLVGGAAIFNNKSNPTLRFVTIRDNQLGDYAAGLPYAGDANNWGRGGGIFTFAGSEYNPVGGFYNSGDVNLINSIVWNNEDLGIQFGHHIQSIDDFAVNYSNVQGGWSGTGANNSDADPQIDANSVPVVGSPVVNTGDPGVHDGEDIRGIPRPVPAGGVVDRGAVEASFNGPVPACLQGIPLDFYVQPKITNPFDLYDPNNSVNEAPVWKLQVENKTFDCDGIPEDQISVTVTDILGRSASCTSSILVTESKPPTAVVNPMTINLLPTGQYTLTDEDRWAIGDRSFDNCSPWTISVVPSNFRCQQAGKDVFVTLLVVDNQGNPASISTLLRIRDVTPPTVHCTSIDVELDQFGYYELTQTDLQSLGGATTDACGMAWGFATSTLNEFTCANIGAVPVGLTLFDGSGNMANCVATVNVKDVTPPTLYGVREQSFTRAQGDYTLEQALAGVSAEDFCEGSVNDLIMVEAYDRLGNPVPFPIDDQFDSGGMFQYVFRLDYTAVDSSGNEALVSTTLSLYDLALPEITVLGEKFLTIECGDEYIDAGATAYDPNTGTDITELLETLISVNKDDPGVYNVTYFILLEDYGLYVQEQRTVTVVDTRVPVITLAGDLLVGIQAGTAYTEPGFTAMDHCLGDVTASVVVSGTVDTNTAGEYVLSYDVTDGYQSAETQTRRVLVGDLIAFLDQPEGARMYTTAPPHTLGATYVGGLFVSGHQWYRDMTGLGLEPPEVEGNSVTLTVDPAVHPLGVHDYRLEVYDELGTHPSATAQIEVEPPLGSTPLENITLVEGENYSWGITVSGGLGDVSYQWYRKDQDKADFVPVQNGWYPHPTLGPGKYSGATSSTLTFGPYAEGMAGEYQVEVSDDFMTIIVGPATLTHGTGIPVAGILGLGVLALTLAFGGAAAARKRR